MKAWGRRLPSTLDTQKVPKVFWISGRGPTTCAVHVDVDSYDLWAVDDFRLADVASAAEEVVAQCLSAKSKVGLAYPAGVDGHVHAKVRGFGGSPVNLNAQPKSTRHIPLLMAVHLSGRKADLRKFAR